LRDYYLIDIYLTNSRTVRESIEEYIKREAKRLEKPTRELGEEELRKS